MGLEFWIYFRRLNLRWPMRVDEYEIEVWRNYTCIMVLPGSLDMAQRRHYLAQADLSAKLLEGRKPLAKTGPRRRALPEDHRSKGMP